MQQLFDSLESRRYLGAQILDIDSLSQADLDGDGAYRGSIVTAYLYSSTPTSVYLKGFEDDGGAGDDVIFRSPIISVGTSGASFTAPIFSDLYGLPGDDTDGWVEFRVEMYDAMTNALLASRDWRIDPNLGPVRYETSSNDGGTIGIAPTVGLPSITPDTDVTIGDTFVVTSRVIDGSSFDHNVEGAYFWIDLNRNGTFDPVTEGPTLRRMSLVDGTASDGTWRVAVQATSELGTGSLRCMVTAWDFDANPRNSQGVDLTVAAGDSPPVINSAQILGPFVNSGAPFSVIVAATDDHAVTSVESFVDVNRNGVYNAGIDFAGPTDSNAADGWVINLLALPQYVNQSKIRVGVRALDSGGQMSSWSFAEILHNPAPVVLEVSITGLIADGTPRLFGSTLTVHALATDNSGIPRAVTFFVDKNNDTIWTPGVDVDLGADFSGLDGFSRTVTITSAWGTPQQQVRIAAAAVDAHNAWSLTMRSPVVRLNDRPVITNLAASSTNVLANAIVTITATVQDSNPRAVTFFYDANGNGAWDGGIDQDLGADYNAANGWSRQIAVSAGWITPAIARIVADVVDADGVWGTLPRASVLLNVSGPAIFSITIPATVASFGETLTVSAFVIGAYQTRAVTFFLDQNNNGVWNSGIDVDLGADLDASGGWTRTFTVNSAWGAGTIKRICAAAVDVRGTWSVPVAAPSIKFVNAPFISGVSLSSSNIASGSILSYQALAQYGSGVRAVTSFIDLNGDGRWTSGVDVDLGISTLTHGSAMSGTWTRSLPWIYGLGTFRIVVDAVGLNGIWSGHPWSVTLTVHSP